MNKFKVISAFLVLSLIWGAAFVAIKITVEIIPPIHAAMIRMWIAVPFLWVLFRSSKQTLKIPRPLLPKVYIAGLFMIGIPYCFVFWGETKVPAGLGGVINGMVPIWTVLVSGMSFWGVRATKSFREWSVAVGVTVGFLGLLVIFWPKITAESLSLEFWGTASLVMMAFCYGTSNVMNARILNRAHNVSIAANVFHQHFISLFFLSFAAMILEWGAMDWAKVFEPKAIGGLLYLGIVSGAGAQVIYYYLIREIGAIKGSAIAYLIPLASLFLDFSVLGTVPSLISLLGTALILLAIFFIRKATTETSSPESSK